MEGMRCGRGWWTLGMAGFMCLLSYASNRACSPLGIERHLGDLLATISNDRMLIAARNGLFRVCKAPHLAMSKRERRLQAAAEDALARGWEDRQAIFIKPQQAETEGKLSHAVALYQSFGKHEEGRRMLTRQKEEGA